MTAAANPTERLKDLHLSRLIAATSLGNALEWYDIAVYGFFASYIAKAFFPAADETFGLLLALGTFAISFLARPIGAIVLGSYADKHGRKSAMLVCIMLMVFGTAMITFMPVYSQIGVIAPIGILVARLIQGFSAGGEYGSATAFLVEHAPERRGFIASWQFASQGLSSVLASLFGVVLTSYMPAGMLADWGWRIPFAFGLLVGPVGLYIRQKLVEPTMPAERSQGSAFATVFAAQKLRLLVAIGTVIMSTAVNYLIVYMPTYAVKNLGVSATIGFISTLCGALILAGLTPFVGHWSDTWGRWKVMMVSAILMLFSFFPCFVAMNASPGAATLVAVVVWLAFLKSVYCGALPALMSDLFPTATRATGLSLSYNVAVTAFGGLGPFVMTWLTSVTGDNLAPSYYLMALALLTLMALVAARRKFGIN